MCARACVSLISVQRALPRACVHVADIMRQRLSQTGNKSKYFYWNFEEKKSIKFHGIFFV